MAAAGEWEVTGQRVLVTGASSGLGLAMARALAAGGARVALGARDAGRLGEAVRSLGATTADVRAVPLDVRDSAAIARATPGASPEARSAQGQRLRRGLVHSRVLRGRETVLTVGKAGFRLILAIHKGGKYQLATIRITVCDSACRDPVWV